MTSYSDMEDRIQEGLNDLSEMSDPNIASYARENNLPYRKLLARWHGTPSKLEQDPRGRKLNEEQEQALIRFIDSMDEKGLCIRKPMVTDAANSILKLSHEGPLFKTPVVGPNWTKRFLERHPEFTVQRQKTLDLNRKMAHDPLTIETFFWRYKAAVQKYAIQLQDIWNFDETGFRIGIGKNQWIVTRDNRRPAYIPSSTSRELVTCIEAVSADGRLIPPMLIIAGKNHMEQWYPDELNEETLIGVSETGYSNDELSMDWLRHFDRMSRRCQVGVYRLLIMDGYGSHCTYEFITYCDEARILPFCLPSHATHLLQPLDVVIFQPYKHYHKETVDQATRTGCGDFNKTEFIASLEDIRLKTFKPKTIRSSFRKTGLVPYNPKIVLEKLREYNPLPSTPATPTRSAREDPKTPYTVRSMVRSVKRLRELSLSPSAKQLLEVFCKGSVVTALTGAQTEKELARTKTAEKGRQARNGNRRFIQPGGFYTRKKLVK